MSVKEWLQFFTESFRETFREFFTIMKFYYLYTRS